MRHSDAELTESFAVLGSLEPPLPLEISLPLISRVFLLLLLYEPHPFSVSLLTQCSILVVYVHALSFGDVFLILRFLFVLFHCLDNVMVFTSLSLPPVPLAP